MRPLALLLCVALGAPALATDDTEDTDVVDTDTDATTADLNGRTASEISGDDGGLDCSAVGTAGLGLPMLLVAGAMIRRRRQD